MTESNLVFHPSRESELFGGLFCFDDGGGTTTERIDDCRFDDAEVVVVVVEVFGLEVGRG